MAKLISIDPDTSAVSIYQSSLAELGRDDLSLMLGRPLAWGAELLVVDTKLLGDPVAAEKSSESAFYLLFSSYACTCIEVGVDADMERVDCDLEDDDEAEDWFNDTLTDLITNWSN